MYYELYIDVLFLVNFMMDSLLLMLVGKMLKCSTTHGRIVLGGLTGALCTCVIIALPIPGKIIKFILFHTLVNTAMIIIGLKIKEKSLFLKALGMLYISAFLMGGLLTAFRPYVRIGSLFYATAIAGFYIIRGIWMFMGHLQKLEQVTCEVTLYTDTKEYTLKALIDTGNGLRDEVSGKPVSIIDKSAARYILEKEHITNIRYIPYRTVDKTSVMPIVRIPKMCVHQRREYWITKPILGICEERISEKNEYQMILNPDMIGGI